MLGSIAIPIPWYELWLPINAGTIPAHVLAFVWVLVIPLFVARPTLRPHLRRILWYILIGHLAATLWALTHGLLGLRRWAFAEAGTNSAGFADVASNPQRWFYIMMRSGMQTAGILGEFAAIFGISGIFLLLRPRTRLAEQVGAQNP